MSQIDKKRKRADDHPDQAPEQPSKAPKLDSAQESTDKPHSKEGKNTGTARQKKSERKTKKQLKREQKKSKRPVSRKPSVATDGLATGEDFVSLGEEQNNPKPLSRVKSLKHEAKSSKGSSPRSIRKQRIAAKKAAEAAGITEQDAKETSTIKNEDASNAQQKSRFIVFVGNLPYDATTEQIQTHFAKLQPASIRHQTDKKTGQSKGFAFLEFNNYDRMKTCLQLYHHSIFDPHGTTTEDGDEIQTDSKKPRGRKLNVELTAGGGGKSDDRKNKIKEKNKKLSEQRERVKLKHMKKRADAERKRILKAEKEAKSGKRTGANAEAVTTNGSASHDAEQADAGDIHPSRLGRFRK